MKKLLVLLVAAALFVSCEKDEVNETENTLIEAKILGNWEIYYSEEEMSVIDQWTGTEWTTVDKWFDVTPTAQLSIEFKEDGTFVNRYVEVEDGAGLWEALEDGSYVFNFIQGENPNDSRIQTRYITVHCDNTISVEAGENSKRIDYYRIIGTTECSDQIEYNL